MDMVFTLLLVHNKAKVVFAVEVTSYKNLLS